MDKHEIKEYNKKYYAEHKEEIKKALSKKEKCVNCGRMVAHSSMMRHKKSSLCRASHAHEMKTLIDKIMELETKLDLKMV
jgi:hypothetical protein